jgi:ribosomal protein L14E/L6E/L27E
MKTEVETALCVSDVVVSLNGRDADKRFFIVGLEGEYALLADGRGRRAEKPKRKKLRHIRFVLKSASRAAEKLRNGEKITNAELRRALAELSATEAGEGGM